ncbi:50S ribosomal protein L3 [Brumimicrobium glaciale]|jgi:large subunit ribosomal protein L3|uniref:Large ribosomal subunit protein uL3 n=1 Tax=Brumimicrobium glaciale TaxID=200475 RepID=A0A4Q4KI62_9FLAO|nr:50S ribosomal protein L3 [Brumimicrobium glaciale]RYM32460.1 50S ribosomal protein L3 [Brumimicrobium glaciale]
MPGIIGRKVGMTSVYSVEGKATPCTVIEAGPCVVTQVKTSDRDGYDAIQLGFGERKEKNTPNALKGHFKKANTTPKSDLVEFDGFEQDLKAGEVVNAAMFVEGELVNISGTSKGKGFQGVVKRHGFHGSETSHGQKSMRRAPGSIGMASTPGRVFKGKKMAGQMGNHRVTIENLEVIKVLADKNIIVVKGSIPGAKGSTVIIEK